MISFHLDQEQSGKLAVIIGKVVFSFCRQRKGFHVFIFTELSIVLSLHLKFALFYVLPLTLLFYPSMKNVDIESGCFNYQSGESQGIF